MLRTSQKFPECTSKQYQKPDLQLSGTGALGPSNLSLGASLVVQLVKNPSAMWKNWVRSLVWEDPLQKEMETHSSVLARKSHGQRSLVGYSPWCCRESDTTMQLTYTHQYPCLGNPMDGAAWWATVHGSQRVRLSE